MHILTDASSLVTSYELVNGIQKPSAINLFELARLVEAIIIHDKVTVLDTSPEDSAEEKQIAIACDAIPGDFFTVKKMAAYEIITRYVDQTCPGFSHDLEQGSDYSQRYARSQKYERVIDNIERLLLNGDAADMKEYAELLKALSSDTKPTKPSWWSGKQQHEWYELTTRRESRPGAGFFTSVSLGPARGSSLDVYENQSAIFAVYCKIYRLCDPSGGSGFAQWRGMSHGRYSEFAQSMFSRSNLYILAGELFNAPYRPGALRWPICWRHFMKRNIENASVAESFVRTAEALELQQIHRVKELLGNGSLSFPIPLFLRVAMKECTTPEEIIEKAISIRNSSEATRFRALSQQLTQKLKEGRFDVLIRELSNCSKDLSKVFGLAESDAKWTLLSAPAISMKPYYALDPTVAFGASGKTILELGQSIWKWWKARRFGLIVRSANSVKSMKLFSNDVQKMFKHTIQEEDIQLLSKLERFGPTDTDE